MPDLNLQYTQIQIRVVEELPKNVSKKNLYSVELNGVVQPNAYSRIVNYKKSGKMVYYLYILNKDLCDTWRDGECLT